MRQECVSDNGPNFTGLASCAGRKALVSNGTISIGKAAAERLCRGFSGRLRDEFLNETLFSSLDRHASSSRCGGRLQHERPPQCATAI